MSDMTATTVRDRLRAAAHPIRLEMMSLLSSDKLSAGDLGRRLGISQAAASYHVRKLTEAGLIEPAEQVRVRGGTSTLYRYVVEESASGDEDLDDEGLAAVRDLQLLELQTVLAAVERRASLRDSGTTLVGDLDAWVTPEAWERVVTGVHALLAELHTESAKPDTEGTIHIGAAVQMFPMTK